MISSVDTNILIDVLSAGPYYAAPADRLDELAGEGTLAVGEVVYAQLAAAFAGEGAIDPFFGAIWHTSVAIIEGGPQTCRRSLESVHAQPTPGIRVADVGATTGFRATRVGGLFPRGNIPAQTS